LPDEGREASHCDDVSVTARVDGDLGRDRRASFLGVSNDPVDFFATLDQRAEHRRVEEDLDTSFGEKCVGHFPPDQWIVHAGERLAVTDRRRESAAPLHSHDEFIEKAVHHLPRRCAHVVRRRIHTADRPGQAGDRAAATEPVSFDQHDARTATRRDDGSCNTRCAAADHEHIAVELQFGPIIQGD
jgi:hypothetical protein